MDLLPFQIEASTQIADRYSVYHEDPLKIRGNQIVPFYQNLASITGSGKTLILADAISQIRSRLPVEPIVLWLSKGKVVVWQTYNNLAQGKYTNLVGGFDVKPLSDCKPQDVLNSSRGLILVATVGKFNQKDQEKGDRKIFRVGLDMAEQSLWDTLKTRKDEHNRTRPFIVVYDEGHNLTAQQTKLLLELFPDALIAASATLKVPDELSLTIERLRRDNGWKDEDFTTFVRSSEVAKSGLVKKHIAICGYLTPMETAINDLVSEMEQARLTAIKVSAEFVPKAIYVSNTNVADKITPKEDLTRPFNQREARPILIWRHLVENAGVDPKEIAVYCDLKFDAKTPPPPTFNLFSGGDSDYDRFMAGDYHHIIFNLSLQEGWDDPTCGFCYIDKDMASPGQVTQIVGRVLRQPGAQHYTAPILNIAHFYIRTDDRGTVESIVNDVNKKLVTDQLDITLTVTTSRNRNNRPMREALKKAEVPVASVNSAAARGPIKEIIDQLPHFEADSKDTVGKGAKIRIQQTIGKGTTAREEWIELEHSNRVRARWVFIRELQRHMPLSKYNPLNLCDTEDPRFDVLIEHNSLAAHHYRECAKDVAQAYVNYAEVIQNARDSPYIVDSIPVDEASLERFQYAVHQDYSGLNDLELPFAKALDATKKMWCRNPSQGGYSIPLLDLGDTSTFNPDFLVWVDKKTIVAIETKGEHLFLKDSGRKLFHIKPIAPGPAVTVRMVTQGKWSMERGVLPKQIQATDGCTVWTLKQGTLFPFHCKDMSESAHRCLKQDS